MNSDDCNREFQLLRKLQKQYFHIVELYGLYSLVFYLARSVIFLSWPCNRQDSRQTELPSQNTVVFCVIKRKQSWNVVLYGLVFAFSRNLSHFWYMDWLFSTHFRFLRQ
jgi:hypothetical protein